MAEPVVGERVLDTSVWINLLATNEMDSILTVLGGRYLAPKQVFSELRRCPITGTLFSEDKHPLALSGHVSIVSLNEKEADLFLELVSAPAADGLGDGEAAAIAVAVERGLALAVDERKARRIIRERFPALVVIRSVDLLTHPCLAAHFGPEKAATFYENARKFGRMHVL